MDEWKDEWMKGVWQVGSVQGFDWIEVSPISLHRSQN